MQLQEFIDQHIEKIRPLEHASRVAWWNLAVTGEEIYSTQMQDANIRLRKIYSSAEDYRFLLAQPPQEDPKLSRQLSVLLNEYAENQIPLDTIEEMVKLEAEIEAIYTNFRVTINGQSLSNNDLKEILVESIDSRQRQEAWEVSKLIGEQVQDRVLKLVELRNASAKKVGFENYYNMRLKFQELDEKQLFALLSQLDEMTKPYWLRYKAKLDEDLSARYGISISDLMPWHYQDPFFQEAPRQELNLDPFYEGLDIVEISRLFYATIGLDVEDILARSDLWERERKNQHAFCICLDRKQDVRILCNLRANEYWMATQLHELGHAVYDKYINQTLPFLLRVPAHISTTEAIAMLFGRLSKKGQFLKYYGGLEDQTAQEIDKLMQKQLAANLLVFARWVLVMVHFERAMYQNPTADLNPLWWEYVKRYQAINPVLGRDKPDWTAKLHLACAPVYYQNYLLGEMTASQLQHHLDKLLKSKNENFYQSSLTGKFLKDHLFSLGASFDWNETIRLSTGEYLDVKYFVEDIKACF